MEYMKNGMTGLMVGDALGVPVQFMSREAIKTRENGYFTRMESGGVYHMPAGTWSDDTSMALATLSAIQETGAVIPEDIMLGFVNWEYNGAFTQYGKAFDEGITCSEAIQRFLHSRNWRICGKTGEHANGNGALMRILPVCIFLSEKVLSGNIPDSEAIKSIHEVTALTHNHLRAKIGSGIYYFTVKEIMKGSGSLFDCLKEGVLHAREFYRDFPEDGTEAELQYYDRLFDLEKLSKTEESEIRSSGYVIDTIEAVYWSLLRTDNFRDCLITAVNLGDDADTVGAIAGGLAGMYYGMEEIPSDWLSPIVKREMVRELCETEPRSQTKIADIHVHVLPGLDDGSTDIDMSMQMISCAYRQGVRAVICTPHADSLSDVTALSDGWQELCRRCKDRYPDFELGIGCEIFCTPVDIDEIIDLLNEGYFLSMNGTKYVLAEFASGSTDYAGMKECLQKLIAAGWKPIVAHAERYGRIYRSFDDVKNLKKMGCLIQVNAYSLSGETKSTIKDLACAIVQEKLADFIGSDGHRMNHRPPKLLHGAEKILKLCDPAYAERLLWKNARELLFDNNADRTPPDNKTNTGF